MAKRLYMKMLFLFLLASNVGVFPVRAQTPRIWVEPALGTANVGETYTIYVHLDDVTGLYALDIRFAWGSSVLEYIDHYYHIPWWEFPGDGVLNDPVTIARNVVNKNAGTYELVAFSYGTAMPWDGSGIVFDMTFQVKQIGECALYFTATTLADQAGGDIEHTTEEGYFEVSGLGDVPVADFTYSPTYPVINRTATLFDGSASYDPDGGGIASYIWDWGDGTSRETTSSPTITHTYIRPGTGPTWEFDVKLSVVDVEGSQSKTVTQKVTVRHPAPVARFTTWPPPDIQREAYAVINRNITFDASESFDPDLEAGDLGGGIDTYKWEWGTWIGGEINITFTDSPVYSRNYTYKNPDGFSVTLTVNDTEGRWSSPSLEVTIFIVDSRDVEVTDIQVTPAEIRAGEIATVNATITNIGQAEESLTVSAYYNGTAIGAETPWIKIGEENLTSLAPSANATAAFDWDTHGLPAAYYQIKVNTTEVPHEMNLTNNEKVSDAVMVFGPPVARFTYSPALPIPGEIITFDASESYDLKGTIVEYRWDFNDTTVVEETDPLAFHSYVASGVYIVNLTVTDNEGNSSSVVKRVGLVSSPIASFTYSPVGPVESERVIFDASESYSPEGAEIVWYTWNFDDGIAVETEEPLATHRFEIAGSYTVNLTVTDEFDLSGSTTISVVIGRGSIEIEADVGTTHFVGEMVEFYALVKFLGEPVNATKIHATLYGPQGKIAHFIHPQNITSVDSGLYRIAYTIPLNAPEGTYTMVAQSDYYALHGATLKSFLLSSTLKGWNALLLQMKNQIATIVIPNLGEIKANLTQIKATLARIEGAVGIIDTSVGEIKTSLALINATLTDVEDMTGTISSDLGEIKVQLNSINATLVEIITNSKGEMLARLEYFLGTQGTITVRLEDIKTKVTAINDNVATVQSSVGTIEAGVGGVQGAVLYVTTVFSAIAAIAAIVALLLLRKQTK